MSKKIEMGDFQTPDDWAQILTSLLPRLGMQNPSIIVEPTCGVGSFVRAASLIFPKARIFGYDINPEYVAAAKNTTEDSPNISISTGDFFLGGYSAELTGQNGEVLFLGNPPWVTNAVLSSLGSRNLPKKENVNALRGIEAITGKSNFDISEWMICRLTEYIQVQSGSVAMICKSAVARKVLSFAASKKLKFCSAVFIPLDSKKIFAASVDCGFLFYSSIGECRYEISLQDQNLAEFGKMGERAGQLVSDVIGYDKWSFLDGANLEKWRSGLKHDCSAVFEFRKIDEFLVNGKQEAVDIEEELVYPFLKSSDLANGRVARGDRFVLVTQKKLDRKLLE